MRIRYFLLPILLEAILSAQAIHADPFPQSIHPYTVEFIRHWFVAAYPQNSEPGSTTIRAMRSDGVSVQRQFYPKGNPLEGMERGNTADNTGCRPQDPPLKPVSASPAPIPVMFPRAKTGWPSSPVG